jgi:hypothetical protein
MDYAISSMFIQWPYLSVYLLPSGAIYIKRMLYRFSSNESHSQIHAARFGVWVNL